MIAIPLLLLSQILSHYQPLIDYAGPRAASQLVAAARQAESEFGVQVDPERLATLAKYESGFNSQARGRAGERGMLQIHPCHRKGMKRLNLDFDRECDRLVFSALLYSWHGDQPWTVRRKARRDYARYFADDG